MLALTLLLLVACGDKDDTGVEGDGGAVEDGGGGNGGSDGGTDGGTDGGASDGGSDGGTTDGGAESPATWSWGSVLTPDDSDASLLGTDAHDYAGICLSRVGDIDGDGFEDLAAGVRGTDLPEVGSGAVYLVRGRADGWVHDEPIADHLLILPDDDYELCFTRDFGDLTGDGRPDLFLREGYSSVDSLSPAWVLASEDTPAEGPLTVSELTTTLWPSEASYNTMAWSFAPGDFTGDGVPDLFAQEYGSVDSATHVIAGPLEPGEVFFGEDSYAVLRMEVIDIVLEATGDLNGDGAVDMLAERQQGSEHSYLVRFGGDPVDGTWMGDADMEIDSPGRDSSVTLLPDIDGDGMDELAISFSNEGGKYDGFHLFWGREAWPDTLDFDDADLVIERNALGYVPGFTADLDLNGDGLHDLLTVSYDADGERLYGFVYGRSDRFEGGLDTLDFDVTLDLDVDLNADLILSEHGDLDGDGWPELIFSDDQAHTDTAEYPGRILVIRGRESWPAVLTDDDVVLELAGTLDDDYVSAEALLDLNGDGYDDLVFGTYKRPEHSWQGQVQIFFGQPYAE